MPLQPGDHLGPYEIAGFVGAGGMGEVYRARDPRLNRDVAIKVLHATVAADAERLRRFTAEAQAVAALNHPNVLTIYEVGTLGEHPFIATELLEGATLRATLEAGAVPLSKAIDYARQTASGLAAAHAKGVAHRDIKPENLFVTTDGRLKILDFGLAKTYAPAPQASAETTRTQAETSPGTVMGTAGYMSPEQVRARPIDHRTDIFSLGVVLYEMLAGRRPFGGDSTVETMNAILTVDPPDIAPSGHPLPPALLGIVRHCLEKNPDERFQSARDLSFALQSISGSSGSGSSGSMAPAGRSGRAAQLTPSAASRRMAWLPLAAVALAAAGVGAALALWGGQPTPPAAEMWRVRRLTNDSGVTQNPAISGDGKLVAYVSDRGGNLDVWVQQVAGGDPVQLTRDIGVCRDPAFSPDGSRIVVTCGLDRGAVYVVPTLGGLPRRIGDGEWARFSPDGSQISYVTPLGSGLAPNTIWIAPANGGPARELKAGRAFVTPPVWHPDGKSLLLVSVAGANEFDWYLAPVDSGAATPTGAGERLRAVSFSSGRDLSITEGGVLFTWGTLDSTNVYRMPFDAEFRRASGHPVPVIVGAGYSASPTSSADGRRIAFAVGANPSTNIWRAPVDAKTGEVSGSPARVTDGLAISLMPSPSQDGKRLAYRGGTLNAPELRLRDLATNADRRLAGAEGLSYLVLSPDGSTVAFSDEQSPSSSIYIVPATGGVPKKVCDACGRPIDWLPDRSKILVDGAGPKQRDIHIVDVASGRSKPLLQHPDLRLTMPRVSPDGRALTFSQNREGRARRIYLAPFTGEPVPESQWSLLVDGTHFDRQPVWSPSGDIVYFQSDRDGTRCIWAQRVDTATRKAVGPPFAAHHIHQLRYYLTDIGDPAAVGLTVVNGQMYFAGFETRSNVWMAERRDGAP
jgi:eukaryotic-like serine/threonine-protein kinase